MRLAGLAPLLAMLAGCATVPTDGGARSQLYVGVVRVIVGEGDGPVRHVSVKTLGAGWDGAGFLGWRAADYVRADPRACQVLIVVRHAGDVRTVEHLVEALQGEKPCVITTDPSPPPSPSPP